MTEKQRKSLLRAINTAMGEIDAMSDLELIKGHELPVLVDKNTLNDIGYGVVIQLNQDFTYGVGMLEEWGRMLKAYDWSIHVDDGLYVTYKVRYKED